MTQKQTGYDKALNAAIANYKAIKGLLTDNEICVFAHAFEQGYRFGVWQQMEKQKAERTDHERNLIALGDDYMTARERAILDGSESYEDPNYEEFCLVEVKDAYRQGWNDSDAFEGRWINKHPENLLNRLLNEFPEIIENEVKARMADIRKEVKENEDAFASASDKSLMRAEFAKAAMNAIIINNDIGDDIVEAAGIAEKSSVELLAQASVMLADALIRELGKEEE